MGVSRCLLARGATTLLLSIAASLAAADTLMTRLDNDMFARPPSDTNYTMGVAIQVRLESAAGESRLDRFVLFDALTYLDSKIWALHGSGPSPYSVKRTWILQDDAFTPACLHTAAVCAAEGHPIDRDRPYANIIWTGVRRSEQQDDGWRATSEFNVGLYGTSIGKDVQTEIHKQCCRDKIPQEWDTQIGNGGAPSFLYKQLTTLPPGKIGEMEFETKYGFWLGWNTWLTWGGGLNYRALSASLDASLVLYNQSLQGAWSGQNKITYGYSDMEHIVFVGHVELDLGRLLFPDAHKKFDLVYGQHWKTRELTNQFVEPIHRWGSLELRIHY